MKDKKNSTMYIVKYSHSTSLCLSFLLMLWWFLLPLVVVLVVVVVVVVVAVVADVMIEA